jgi:general secretion pathway protein G
MLKICQLPTASKWRRGHQPRINLCTRRTHHGTDGPASNSNLHWRGAFTLLELLTVITIIAVLVSLGFGLARRAQESGRTARVRTELTLLASALGEYHRAYGDYPQTADAAAMLQALLGKRGPRGATIAARPSLDLLRFTTRDDRNALVDPTAVLLDPWDRPYRYAYATQPAWSNPRYVLYSAGPDGLAADALLPGGYADGTPVENHDNLYADRL